MNADWAPGGRQPSDQANWLGLWVRRKLAATIHIHHRHCYYYSAPLYGSTEDGRLIRPRHCSRDAQPVSKAVYGNSCRDKHNRPQCDSNLGPLTPQSDALITSRTSRTYSSSIALTFTLGLTENNLVNNILTHHLSKNLRFPWLYVLPVEEILLHDTIP